MQWEVVATLVLCWQSNAMVVAPSATYVVWGAIVGYSYFIFLGNSVWLLNISSSDEW